MAEHKGFTRLKADLKAEQMQNVYIFYGEETYLRARYLQQVRQLLIPAGFEEFNDHHLSGKGLTVQALSEVVEAMPMMAQHTLVTVEDMDLFKLDESQRNALIALLEDFPEYCTLIFIYDTLDYKRDGKMKKLCAALDKHVCAVEFAQQERAQLVNWLRRRFTALGHDIDSSAADHLLFTCGTLMTDLVPEIEKIAAYAKQERITIDDINAVADPVLDARVFDMTNCGAGQGAAEAVHRPHGAGYRQGSLLAEAAVEHEQRLSRQAAATGGEKGGSRLVQQRRHPLPAAGSPHEK